MDKAAGIGTKSPFSYRRSNKIRPQKSEKSALPNYPSRIYDASLDELEGLGVTDARGLLDKVNQHLLATKKWPVSVGDFPKSRNKFLRLVERWHRIQNDQA